GHRPRTVARRLYPLLAGRHRRRGDHADRDAGHHRRARLQRGGGSESRRRLERRMAGHGAVHALPAAVRNRRADSDGRPGCSGGAGPASAQLLQAPEPGRTVGNPCRGSRAHGEDGHGCALRAAIRARSRRGAARMSIPLSWYIVFATVLFCISIAGLFINRKNVIVLLMCIELMLLAVNTNFVAFSRFLGNPAGQVFVFFILTVAAAESAIGLAIVVLLFRNRRTINVEEIDSLKY